MNKVHLKLHIHLSQPNSEQKLQGTCENCDCFVHDFIVISKVALFYSETLMFCTSHLNDRKQ